MSNHHHDRGADALHAAIRGIAEAAQAVVFGLGLEAARQLDAARRHADVAHRAALEGDRADAKLLEAACRALGVIAVLRGQILGLSEAPTSEASS